MMAPTEDGHVQAHENGEPKEMALHTRRPSGNARPGWIFLLGGACFPLGVVFLELTTRMCALDFTDPMPTFWHVVLVVLVPLANGWTWLALRRYIAYSPRTIGMANGYALGVSFLYTLWFLPMLPIAVIAVIVWGLGLLPMAPLFSFIAAMRGYFHLKRLGGERHFWKVPGTVQGLVIFLVAVAIIQVPVVVTRLGMNLACSESPEVRGRAIQVLRVLGNDDMMLHACYVRWNRAFDPLNWFGASSSVDPAKAREIFYQVTGTAFNAVPPPAAIRGWGGGGLLGFGAFDDDQGGSLVGGRAQGVALDSSRIDGSVDGDAGLAYIEWTLEFKNYFQRDREARAQIALPQGGVVSRVTLWVNGEEREAAFAGRAKVTEAYQKVVRRLRDPLLVTTSGPDRVMMQCFPVPASGKGTMKIRIGITAPLALKNKERALLRLPRFVERNFHISGDKRHLVWIESKRHLQSAIEHLVCEQPPAKLFTLRGQLSERELLDPKSVIRAARSPQITTSWCDDPVQAKGAVVIQRLEEKTAEAPERIALVVDGSRGMRDFIPQLVEALSALPSGIELAAVILSNDEPSPYVETASPTSRADVAHIAGMLSEFHYSGGRDNVPALGRALDVVGNRSLGAIVWIHQPQPLLIQSVEVLRQPWQRGRNRTLLYSVQVGSGPDRIMEKLDGIREVKSVPRMGSLKEDLEALFGAWKPNASMLTFSREMTERQPEQLTETTKKTSDHLARLWGYDEVLRLYAEKASDAREKALIIAGRYHLVTPVSGAVVLENAGQFKAEGLEPADSSKVPVIPEPETWALIMVAIFIVLFVSWRRVRPCKVR